jgi:uncharacterized protein YhhL (DUF1145 family)
VRVTLPFIGWATLLTILAAVLWVWSTDGLPAAIFGGAAAVAWLVALYALLQPFPREPRGLGELSFSGALLALGIAMLVLSALVGEWLVLIGAGTTLAGLVGTLVERRAP